MRPMRVAHLLPNMAIGGRERMVAELCQRGMKAGIKPALVCYDPLPEGTSQIGHDIELIQLNRKASGFRRNLGYALSNFDLVHAQGHIPAHYVRHSGYLGPSIATMHIGMESGWRWLWPVRQGLRAMHHLAAVSEPMAALYTRISGRAVETVANGISIDRFSGHRAWPPAANEPFRFAMLSRLHSVKRHQDAIAAMDCIIAAGQDVKLIIAGEGAVNLRLQKLAASRPYVQLVGAVHDIAPFLAKQHALILCSEQEGMPVTLIEAMAAGLPIIASDVGGVSAVTGQAALLVAPKRPDQLAFNMMRLYGDPQLWSYMAKKSIRQAAVFDSSTMTDHYAALYQRLLLR
jgi:glycosyltransferase involved in cell wall biosynthesis